MGNVIERVKVINVFEPSKTIEVEIPINAGTTIVVLPQDIVRELELRKVREVKVSLEVLDLVVDSRTRKPVPNPESPEIPIIDIFMANSPNSRHAATLLCTSTPTHQGGDSYVRKPSGEISPINMRR